MCFCDAMPFAMLVEAFACVNGQLARLLQIKYIEDSARSSPVQTDSLNNGFISGPVSPSRTPNTVEQTEEKATLLGSTSEANQDDHVAHGS